MNRKRTVIHVLFILAAAIFVAPPLVAAEPGLRSVIDREVAAGWEKQKIKPASTADDAEFLRRVYLDLCGQIATAEEARDFLADKDPEKRAKLVDRLLADPRYAQHQADLWDMILFGRRPPGYDTDKREPFQMWLRKQFADDVPYDRWVSAILKAEGNTVDQGPPMYFVQYRNQPEDATEAITQTFLGVQLQCARCHDHPYEEWKQVDFYGMAAFLARLEVVTVGKQGQLNKFAIGEHSTGDILFTGPAKDATPGKKGDPIQPKLLLGASPVQPALPKDFKEIKFAQNKEPEPPKWSRKNELAGWIANEKNPYFARAIANRIWAQYMGRGIVHPVDNMSPANVPTHPKLLDELTKELVAQKFDLKKLTREILNTEAYRLSSKGGDGEQFPQGFAAARTRPLSAEELIESWRIATGFDAVQAAAKKDAAKNDAAKPGPDRFRPLGSGYLLNFFGQPNNGVGDFQGGMHEHLYLNNGPLGSVIVAGKGGLVDTVLNKDAPLDQRIERLYLATLNRYPTAAERAKVGSYVSAGEPQELWRNAIWALLTCSEFRFNH
jgi:hypothetical protein